MKKTVYILSGLPYTGQKYICDTLRKNYIESQFLYSINDYIESLSHLFEMPYSKVFRNRIDEAVNVMTKGLNEAIANETEIIIWNHTNLSFYKRSIIVSTIRELEKLYLIEESYNIVYYAIHIPDKIEDWITMVLNNHSDKCYSNETLRQMVNQYMIPGIDTSENNVTYFTPIF